MANLLIPWQRYLSDIAHKYVGYPDDEEDDIMYNIKCYNLTGDQELAQRQDVFAKGVWNESTHNWVASGEIVTEAKAGEVLAVSIPDEGLLTMLLSEPSQNSMIYPIDTRDGMAFVMPAHDVCAVMAV